MHAGGNESRSTTPNREEWGNSTGWNYLPEFISAEDIYKYEVLEELPASFLRFGPVYYDANDALEMAKEEAWKHLLDKFSNGDNYQKNEDIYLDAFKGIVMQLQSWKDWVSLSFNGWW